MLKKKKLQTLFRRYEVNTEIIKNLKLLMEFNMKLNKIQKDALNEKLKQLKDIEEKINKASDSQEYLTLEHFEFNPLLKELGQLIYYFMCCRK